MAQRSRDGVVSEAFLSRLRIGFSRLPHQAEKSESVPARARNLECDVAQRRVLAVLIAKSVGQHFHQNGPSLPAAPEYRACHRKTGVVYLFTLITWNDLNRLATHAEKTTRCEDS